MRGGFKGKKELKAQGPYPSFGGSEFQRAKQEGSGRGDKDTS